MNDERTSLLPHLPAVGASQSDAQQHVEDATHPKTNLAGVIVSLGTGLLLVAIDATLVLSSSAAISSDLHDLQHAGWIATAYMLTTASFQPLYGKFSDIFGRKECLLFAYTVFAAGCLCCGIAQDMLGLVLARALAGLGGGGILTLFSIIISDIVPLRNRGLWQGFFNLLYSVGAAAGAPLGGLLADTIGWRWAFLMQVPAILMAALLSVFTLRLEQPMNPTQSFRTKLSRVDGGGSLPLVLAIFTLVLGLDHGGNSSWRSPITIALLSVSPCLLLSFAFIECRIAPEPITPVRVMTSRSLIAVYAAVFFARGSSLVVLFFVPLYVQAVLGMSAGAAGLLLIPCVVAGVIACFGAGLAMKVTGKYWRLTVVSFFVAALGCGGLTLCTRGTAFVYVGIIAGLAVMSLGNGVGITSSLTALIACAGPADQAIATVVMHLFESLGNVVCLTVGTALFQTVLKQQLVERLDDRDVDEVVRLVRDSLKDLHQLEPHTRFAAQLAYEVSVRSALALSAMLAITAVVASCFFDEVPLAEQCEEGSI